MARVLLVEDDPDLRRMFTRWLRTQDHEVEARATGEGALEELDAGATDAVVLDVRLPGIAGYDVVRRMSERDDLKEIPVVIISVTEPDDLPADLKVAAFVTKPARAKDLHQAVERALALP